MLIDIEGLFLKQREAVKTSNSGQVPDAKKFLGSEANFEDFIIEIKGNKIYFGNGEIWAVQDKETIVCPPMVNYARTKKLIVTSVNNTDEVVEKWSVQGYKMTMEGILVNMSDHTFPRAQVKQLNEMFEYDVFGTITGKLFQDLNITTLYFEGIEISPLMGFEDTVRYRLSANSISPYKFNLKA